MPLLMISKISSLFSNLNKNSKVRWLATIVFVIVVFFSINFNILYGNAVGVWDSDGQFVAYQTLVADYARSGKIALWDILTDAGSPVSGDPQIGTMSPVNVFFGFLFGGGSVGFKIYWLCIWLLGGIGILLLGRHFKVSSYGSAIISLGYLFCGIYVNNAEHISWLVGFSFLPWVIWRLDVALLSKRLLPALQAGAIWGLSGLSSYPGFTIITLIYCGIWSIGRVLTAYNKSDRKLESPLKQWTSVCLSLILGIILGLLILSPTYFSFLYESSGTTTRTNSLSREAILMENPLHLGAISTFSSPYISVQKLYNNDLWMGTDISMTNIYIGGLISTLALFSLFNNRKDTWRWFLFLLAFFCLTCAISQVFPFRGWLYDLVYPTRYFRHSSIFRAYYLLSITVLALLGMRDLTYLISIDTKVSWSSFKASSQILAVSAVLVFITFINSIPKIGGKLFLAYAHLFVIWGGICLIPYLSKYIHKKWKIIPIILLIIGVLDAFCVYKLSSSFIATDDPALVERWKELDQQHSTNLDLTSLGLLREESSCYYVAQSPCTSLNNDQMFKKVPVFSSYNPQVNNFQVAIAKNPVLRNMVTGSERIWFSSQSLEITPSLENFEKFIQRSSELHSMPLVIHHPQTMIDKNSNFVMSQKLISNQLTDLERLPSLERLNVNVIKYNPEELTFEVISPSSGWLLVTDRWARMWKVWVNNAPTEVYGGNFIFRAVRVSAGHNLIHFEYKTFSYPYLLFLSWSSLGILFIISVSNKLKRNKSKQLTTLQARNESDD